MDISALEDLGFTPSEIKIYLALLELGPSRAGPVIRRTKLQNSVVHLTLARMLEKGLVSFFKKGQVRHYQAVHPRQIVRIIEAKKARLETILPQLIAKQERQERQEAEVFEGMAGLRAMLYRAIEESEPGDEYLFFAFSTESEVWEPPVYEFYEQFRRERRARGIRLKGISSEKSRSRFQSNKVDMSEILFVKFPTLQNISIFRNKVIMTPWEDSQISYLITSRQLSESFRTYFNSIWNAYRPNSE